MKYKSIWRIKHSIYVIICPITNAVRYVGMTSRKDVRIRIQEHYQTSHIINKQLVTWLKGLPCFPKYSILQRCNGKASAHKAEKFWIRKYEAEGFDLLNIWGRVNGKESAIRKIEYVDTHAILPRKKPKAA